MHESMNMGGSIITRNIFEKGKNILWCIKNEPVNELDNGWRFFSEDDTDEYLANSDNMLVCDWGTVFEIEPLVSLIFDFPVGTELILEYYDGLKKRFIDAKTGEIIDFDLIFKND